MTGTCDWYMRTFPNTARLIHLRFFHVIAFLSWLDLQMVCIYFGVINLEKLGKSVTKPVRSRKILHR